jgi:tetraacyldisaccharide 4'-kinase
LIRTLSRIYGAAAARRRRWYAADPSRRRRLSRPVVSVGNLRVGGTGKTPIAAYVARLLADAGYRPAILSRGYGRRRRARGATVVSTGADVVAGLDEAGDEPFMLAHALPGVAVVVGASRYACGLEAERLGATVHVLDDGFQHLELHRDVDLLLVDEDDLGDWPLPAGRLREPLEEAVAADAVIVAAGYDSAVRRVADTLGLEIAFRLSRVIAAPRTVVSRESVVVPSDARVFGLAGIARPERFFTDLEGAGWRLVGTMAFRDHHRYSARDIRRVTAAARSSAAAIVLTTEKDAARLAACDLGDLPCAYVPLVATVEPQAGFREWLLGRL